MPIQVAVIYMRLLIPVPTLSTLAVTLSQTPTTSCAEGNDGKVNYTLSGWQAGSTISWKIFNNSTHQQVDTGTAAAVTTPQTAGSALAAGHYYIVFTESPSNCTQVLHFEVKNLICKCRYLQQLPKKLLVILREKRG